MKIQLHSALAVATVVLLSNLPTLAETPAAVSGATATVLSLDTAAGAATIEVTNHYNRDVNGYVIVSVATYASGKTEEDEYGHDFGPAIVSEKNGLLGPGETSRDIIHFTASDNDPLSRVDARVVVVIFTNQTAEVTDVRAFENHMRTRKAAANSLRESTSVLRAALSDSRPSAKAVELLKEAVRAGKGNPERTPPGMNVECGPTQKPPSTKK